jgi:hypothetical protein
MINSGAGSDVGVMSESGNIGGRGSTPPGELATQTTE